MSVTSPNKKVQEEGGSTALAQFFSQETEPLSAGFSRAGLGRAPGNYSDTGHAGAGSEEARDRDWPAVTEITIALVPLSGVRPWPCSGRRGRQTPGSLRGLTEARWGVGEGGASSAGRLGEVGGWGGSSEVPAQPCDLGIFNLT